MKNKIQCQINFKKKNNLPAFLIKKTLKKSLFLLKIKQAEISLAFVSVQEITRLNRIYLCRNYATDVLSFSYYFKNNFLSGEIIICWPVVRKNAQKEKVSEITELKRVLVHGLLHLCGYDHKKNKESLLMSKKEQEIFLNLN